MRNAKPIASLPSAPPAILVVTDDAALAALLTDALREAGHAATAVSDPEEWLALLASPLRAALGVVDAAALDRAAARRLAALRAGEARVPLLLLVAMADADRDAHDPLRPAAVLAKPFGLEQLREAVARLLASA